MLHFGENSAPRKNENSERRRRIFEISILISEGPLSLFCSILNCPGKSRDPRFEVPRPDPRWRFVLSENLPPRKRVKISPNRWKGVWEQETHVGFRADHLKSSKMQKLKNGSAEIENSERRRRIFGDFNSDFRGTPLVVLLNFKLSGQVSRSSI